MVNELKNFLTKVKQGAAKIQAESVKAKENAHVQILTSEIREREIAKVEARYKLRINSLKAQLNKLTEKMTNEIGEIAQNYVSDGWNKTLKGG